MMSKKATTRQALLNLLKNEDLLSDWEWEFVSSCSTFVELSSKQSKVLIELWDRLELYIARGRANRRRLRAKGTNSRAKRTNPKAKGTNPRAKGTNPRALRLVK